jgi:hypothetical protein
MGFTMLVSLMAENSKCREEWVEIAITLLIWGAGAGGLGSLVHFTLEPVRRYSSFW